MCEGNQVGDLSTRLNVTDLKDYLKKTGRKGLFSSPPLLPEEVLYREKTQSPAPRLEVHYQTFHKTHWVWSPKTPTDRPVSMDQTPRTEKQTSRHCSPTLRQQGMRGLELCTVGWERRALSDGTGLSRSPDGVSRPAPPLGRDHCTGGTDMHFNSQLWSVLCGCGTQV